MTGGQARMVSICLSSLNACMRFSVFAEAVALAAGVRGAGSRHILQQSSPYMCAVAHAPRTLSARLHCYPGALLADPGYTCDIRYI